MTKLHHLAVKLQIQNINTSNNFNFFIKESIVDLQIGLNFDFREIDSNMCYRTAKACI